MTRILRICATVMLLAINSIADMDDFNKYKSIYEEELKNLRQDNAADSQKLVNQYKVMLDVEISNAKKRNDLEALVALKKEQEQLSKEPLIRIENNDDVPEVIKTLHAKYESAEKKMREQQDKKWMDLLVKYGRALDKIKRRLIKLEQIENALTVNTEINKIKEIISDLDEKYQTNPKGKKNKPESKLVLSSKFNWKTEKKNVKYTYYPSEFGVGSYDYSDEDCRKLIDGVSGKGDNNWVGWNKSGKVAVDFDYPKLVSPETFRVYICGRKVGGGVCDVDGIKVFVGTEKNRKKLVGENYDLPAESGWVNITLKKQSSKYFRVEFDIGERSWLLIEEVEFN